VLLKIQVVWNVALCQQVNAPWQSEGSSGTTHPSTCYHIPEGMILIHLNLFLMLIFEVLSFTVICHCNLHTFFSLTIYTLTYFNCRGKAHNILLCCTVRQSKRQRLTLEYLIPPWRSRCYDPSKTLQILNPNNTAEHPQTLHEHKCQNLKPYKLIVAQLFKKFPIYYRTYRLIIMFKTDC
jgi:hypothetical protein